MLTSRTNQMTRRTFLGLASGAIAVPVFGKSDSASLILGQGDFRYRVVPSWGQLGDETPVENCHGIVCDREGHIILLTDQIKNNVIIYDAAGKLVHKWGTTFPGAHGLSLVMENGREVLYITDLKRHKIFKTSTSGEILNEWGWPQSTGKYEKEDEYRPSWTLHHPDGSFFILDGYGKDYISQHDTEGKFVKIFGGKEGGIAHWGPHGGMMDTRKMDDVTMLVAMSDKQHLLRLDLVGNKRETIAMPGGNPRQIRLHKDHFFVAHLGDHWPADPHCRGFISVLDAELRVISNIAGRPPLYDDKGILQTMCHQEEIFQHPHDLVVDPQENLYVAQFNSSRTYPIKLERV